MDDERLWALLRIAGLEPSSERFFLTLVQALDTFHAGTGTRDPSRVATRQVRVALCLGDGDTIEQCAKQLGVSRRTVQRDVVAIRSIIEPLQCRVSR